MVSSRSTFSLPILRAIGWTRWNPIGLDGPPDTPADEYDEYLLSAAKQAADGATVDDMTDYLVAIATEHMCLTHCDRERTTRTAAEIKAYVDGLTSRRYAETRSLDTHHPIEKPATAGPGGLLVVQALQPRMLRRRDGSRRARSRCWR